MYSTATLFTLNEKDFDTILAPIPLATRRLVQRAAHAHGNQPPPPSNQPPPPSDNMEDRALAMAIVATQPQPL